MRTTIFILMLALSSCSSYQYLTVASDKTTKNESKELVWENDTVLLRFNFNGAWGQMALSVENKMKEPLTILWQKSSIIGGDTSYSLYDRHVKVEGDIYRNQLYEKKEQGISELPVSTMNAAFNTPKDIDFLPPGTKINRQYLNTSQLVPSLQPLPAGMSVQKLPADGYNIKYTVAGFDSTSSPFRFSIFITYNIGAERKEFYTQHFFYVTEVKQTTESSLHTVLINNDGDKFYYRLRSY